MWTLRHLFFPELPFKSTHYAIRLSRQHTEYIQLPSKYTLSLIILKKCDRYIRSNMNEQFYCRFAKKFSHVRIICGNTCVLTREHLSGRKNHVNIVQKNSLRANSCWFMNVCTQESDQFHVIYVRKHSCRRWR